MPLPITDTRLAFRPLYREIVDLLRTLTAEDWERPTIARAWRVRDVVAHLLDTMLRRLSFHRDRSCGQAGDGQVGGHESGGDVRPRSWWQ